jgi:Domain of unknown function (DUF932)
VLNELRAEGFRPFMVCQTRERYDDRREFTKPMIRLRHESQIDAGEANEIILLNSHDGTSSYQMLEGMLRFVCQNGLVCGDTVADVRVPHKGNAAEHVIGGAYAVLQGFGQAEASRYAMQPITLDDSEAEAHIRHALKLLKPSGQLVAICANGPRQTEQLRPLVEESGSIWEPLPVGTFSESGTGMHAMLLIIEG